MNGKRPTVTIQLTARWLLGLLALLFLVQIVVPSRVWTVLLVGVGGALALGYLWVSQLARHLALHRQRRYGWAHVGDVLEERFAVQNRSLLGAVWLEIDDRSDLPGYSANTVRSVEGRQTLRWRTQATCRQRGLFTLGPWRVHTGDPLGLYRLTLDFAESQSVLVYPPVVHLPELRLPRGIATGAGRTSRRALDVTTHAAGVRAYAPGDSIRQVHWPSTARHDTLMVKTFDLEPSGDLWIVLDLDDSVQAGEGEESTVEYGVILAASLASQSLGENRAVGLVAYGSDESGHVPMPTLVLPQKGKAQEWRILEVLATARTGGHWPLSRVLAEMDRNLGRGTILALITPSCQADWVAGLLPPMRRGVTPTVLLLDPASFGGQGNVEALTALLANLGVTTHRIIQGMPFRPIAEHKRLGPPLYKVLPGYGRVIPVSE
jgi:uncharacterized protein (DUF58 family)